MQKGSDMLLKSVINPIKKIYLKEWENRSLSEIIKLFKKVNCARLYIVNENEELIYVLEVNEILDICHNNKDISLKEYLKDKLPPLYVEVTNSLIDVYNFMRENFLKYVPVLEDGKLIGEIEFDKLPLRIGLIVIQDPLTQVFNEKYFNFLLQEYKEIGDEVGIIYIEVKNLNIIEAIYGESKKNEILKYVANKIKSNVREIDFVFRSGNIFKIVVFAEFSVLGIISKRLKDVLDNTEYDGVVIQIKLAYTHIPTDSPNVLIALEKLEEELIRERD